MSNIVSVHITRYPSRFFAVYGATPDGERILIAVTVYKKGAQTVAQIAAEAFDVVIFDEVKRRKRATTKQPKASFSCTYI